MLSRATLFHLISNILVARSGRRRVLDCEMVTLYMRNPVHGVVIQPVATREMRTAASTVSQHTRNVLLIACCWVGIRALTLAPGGSIKRVILLYF